VIEVGRALCADHDHPEPTAVHARLRSGRSRPTTRLPAEPPDTRFKSAGVRLRSVDEINLKDLKRWLRKSAIIQWDYKNIVKRKGKLVRLM